MKRKLTACSLALSLALLLCMFPISAAAESTVESPTPRYTNILSEDSYFIISDDGVASVYVSYIGQDGVTAGATITVTMQKKFMLFFWQDVDIGDSDGAWVVETNASSYGNTLKVNVTSGTHRVQIEYVIRNVNGTEETITSEYEYKY